MTLEILEKGATLQRDMTAIRTSSRPFYVVASFVLLALTASSTPTPIYSLYAAKWHFSALTVTEVYGVYAVCVLLALLLAGGASDLIGRKPVLLAGLAGLLGAELVFIFAGGLDALYAARTIQGLATGLLLGATGAALIDHHPRRDGAQAGLVNGIASGLGIGLGAFVSSVLVQYAPAPEVTPYVVIAVLTALAIAAAWRLPETVLGERRLTLTPQVPKVPRSLWRTFSLSALGVLASWAVGGLYLSLGPGIVASMLSTSNHVAGGFFVCVCSALAAAAQWVLRGKSNRVVLVGGAATLAAGSAIAAVGIGASSTAAFLAGSALMGVGFGGAFMGALRSLAVVLPPAHRATVMSAFFVVAYAAISIPAIGAGIAAVHIGLDSAAAWFGGAVSVVAAVVAVVGWYELRPRRDAARAARELARA